MSIFGQPKITDAGCHVWPESRHGPCYAHRTPGCCLVTHRSPAAQRAFNQGRCIGCGQFLRSDSYYANQCSDCWTPADEFLY